MPLQAVATDRMRHEDYAVRPLYTGFNINCQHQRMAATDGFRFTIKKICGNWFTQLQTRAIASNMNLSFPKELPKLLAAKLNTKSGGARQMRRIVQDNVEEPLSDYLLRCEESPAALCCVVKEDKLYFRKDTKKAILGVK